MNVFYDVEKAVAEFQANMSRVCSNTSDPEMAAQLRSVPVQAEFIRWSLTEMNLGTDEDDLVHATAGLIANIVVNIMTNTEEKQGLSLLPRVFAMLENNTGETVSEIHVDSRNGGNA